ncbi:ATP-binding protein [Rhizobium sp. A37_96]
MTEEYLSFGPFRLFASRRILEKNGQLVPVGSRAFDVLTTLAVKRGSVVTLSEIGRLVWPGMHLDVGTLRVHIAALRKALGEQQSERGFIVNVPGKGYLLASDAMLRRDPGASLAQPAPPPRISPRTRVIGREAFTRAASIQLAATHLLTLSGPAGVGKTTMALAIADEISDNYADGVHFVDLGLLQKADQIAGELCSVLRLSSFSDNPIDSVLSRLEDRAALLILDNCEHLAPAVRVFVEAVRKRAAAVDILVTSREPLHAEGELIRSVPPLKTPPLGEPLTAEEIFSFPAVELFVERASARSEVFRPSAENAQAIAELCRNLEGIPLAIEFAAARAGDLDLGRFGEGFEAIYPMLREVRLPGELRHRTLRNTISWSYGLLTGFEGVVFRRLSVFSGDFTVEAACDVTGLGGDLGREIGAILASLIAKSLITAVGKGRFIRCRMLNMIREFGREKLDENGEAVLMYRRHAEFCVSLLEEAAAAWSDGVTSTWLEQYGSKLPEVRQSIEWAFSSPGDEQIGVTLTALGSVLFMTIGLIGEYRTLIERALEVNRRSPAPDRLADAKMHAALATIYHHSHDFPLGDETTGQFELSLKAARDAGSIADELRAISGLSAAYLFRGEHEKALTLQRDFDRLEGPDARHVANRTLGHSNHYAGNRVEAERRIAAALHPLDGNPQIKNAGSQFDQRQVTLRSTLANHLWLTGKLDQATLLASRCVDDALAANHPLSLCHALGTAAFPLVYLTNGPSAAAPYLALLTETASRHALYRWLRWAEAYEEVTSPDAIVRNRNDRTGLLSKIGIGGVLAEYTAVLGGEMAIDWVVRQAMNTTPGWCYAELLRICGELELRRSGDRAEAMKFFRQGLNLATSQGYDTWRLRCATSLARVLAETGATFEAAAVLSDVMPLFAEGFESVDFRAARAQLAAVH